MVNIPGITSPALPSIFAAEVTLALDLSDLERFDLPYIRLYNNSVILSRAGVYAVINFDKTYGSAAMRKLLQAYPAEKTKLLLIALRCSMKDIWREQDALTMTQIMAEVLGAK